VESVHGDAPLFEVVLALQACRRLADLLDGGEQEADQNGNDGNYHQQFDQREARSGVALVQRHGDLGCENEKKIQKKGQRKKRIKEKRNEHHRKIRP